MLSGPDDGGKRLAGAHSSGAGKQSGSSTIDNYKNGKLTAFKKIGFSARRALRLVSRSIDNRGAARSGSDGDLDGDASCASQTFGDSPTHSQTPALTHQFSRDSFNSLQHSCSVPTTSRAWDLNAEPPQSRKEGFRPAALPTLPTPPTTQLPAHQTLPSPAPTAPPAKPRSLLSALLKRPTSSAASSAPAVDSAKPITAPAPPPQQLATEPQPQPRPKPPPIACPKHSPDPSPSPESPQPCSPSQPGPQQPCSLGRLYESMPAQERRNPPPHALPVPTRPSRNAAAARAEVCLSAPSPHRASLKQAVMKMDRSGGLPAASGVAAAPPPRQPPPAAAPYASSVPKPSAPAVALAARPGGTFKAFDQQLPSGCFAPLIIEGADEAVPAEPEPRSISSSIPAASLLASSLGGSGPMALQHLGRGDLASPLALAGSQQQQQPRTAVAAAAMAVLQQQERQPAPAATAAAEGAAGASQSVLMAVCSSAPPAMMRSCWCLEDYILQKRLYKGKMASVYKGRCLRSGLPVALKVYFKTRVPTNVVHMVMREMDIHVQASEHRNVLKLYGVFQTEDVAVLVMELAARGSLSNICQSVSGGRLNEAQVRQTILEPLLDALSYLHGKGVCHRDIKPENLLFTSDWGFRLADFGVSINLTEERAVTRAGTADYMAPEVERCPLKVHPDENKHDETLSYTTAADVWSVGVLAYELLVGFPPVVASGGRSTGSHRHGRSHLSFPASVSAGARDFITWALAELPEERPTVRQLRCHSWMGFGAGAGGDAVRRRDIEL
ncbi:hypothetical protein PLESTB_001013600 [Pleodorina starrii]|uniref:Protein kinase domain-containing protein n=1 Tax=Pleodorina starrii TaxID=330485 RepID=A0A9W6F426_9CHLO|nr:hypothetical protein PLESTB_001013600 [Pleodorina starrii]GLC65427.1 hypothetical protein PLESTF_000292100 [Pleodorina starrii]